MRPENRNVVDSVRCTAAVIPLLLKYQGTGKVHAVIQEDLASSVLMDFEGYTGLIEFGPRKAGYSGKDWQHPSAGGGPEMVISQPRSRSGDSGQPERVLSDGR